ncbi:MAG: NmrA family NAD(P)-binding protein [Ardenticatenaceae bacterium]|nr:NmrA family NAD(P)-binding protein [Ardenticatenaceae bacterium]
MILITGAGGKTGRAITSRLAAAGEAVRGWVRRAGVEIEGAAECFVGDLENPADWEKAAVGVDRIYLICPNMHPNEPQIGRLAIEAAQKEGVSRLVYHSVLHPQTEEMPHHWGKLHVEELIVGSGVPFVILQPTAYMQNLRPQLPAIKKNGLLRLPYPPESRISLIDLYDLATAAVRVLLTDKFDGGIFELCGTRPLSQHEVAASFAEVFSSPVRAEEMGVAEWKKGVEGLSDYARETLIKMFRYYAHYGLVGNPAVLEWLLGRPPASLLEVIQRWV